MFIFAVEKEPKDERDMWELLTLLNALITIMTMPLVVRRENWHGVVFLMYFVVVFTATPLFGIPFWIFIRKILGY